MIRMEGARANTVSKMRSFRTVDTCPDSPEPPMFRLIVGIGRGSDHADGITKNDKMAIISRHTKCFIPLMPARLFMFS
jgi:hypothetical protein